MQNIIKTTCGKYGNSEVFLSTNTQFNLIN